MKLLEAVELADLRFREFIYLLWKTEFLAWFEFFEEDRKKDLVDVFYMKFFYVRSEAKDLS